jgi:hypothetical protein
MKSITIKIIATIFLSAAVLTSCSLTSGLSIMPKSSFKLGEGTHGSYTVTATNKKAMPIEVYELNNEKIEILIATLQSGDTKTLNVDANRTLILKNSSNDTASINLKINGDTQLSMRYKENN